MLGAGRIDGGRRRPGEHDRNPGRHLAIVPFVAPSRLISSVDGRLPGGPGPPDLQGGATAMSMEDATTGGEGGDRDREAVPSPSQDPPPAGVGPRHRAGRGRTGGRPSRPSEHYADHLAKQSDLHSCI